VAGPYVDDPPPATALLRDQTFLPIATRIHRRALMSDKIISYAFYRIGLENVRQ
jgi:hypothetical protein